MKSAGYYKCPDCRGSGWTEERSGRDTEYESSTSRLVTCHLCSGEGKVQYDENGDTWLDRRKKEKPLEYYNSSCFPYEAQVETPSGKVPIGKLEKGQLVLSYNQGVLVPRKITKHQVLGLAKIFDVEFDSGTKLCSTDHHSFLTGDGWQQLKKIRKGDVIIQSDSKERVVTSVRSSGKIEPVFNIYTEGEHNFIVEGCVAHNFTEFRAVRTIFHQLFLDQISQEYAPACT